MKLEKSKPFGEIYLVDRKIWVKSIHSQYIAITQFFVLKLF